MSRLTAVRRSQLLARWPGTHSRILSGIQRAAQTVLGVYLKRTSSRVTSASRALAVLNDYVLYKSTHSLTHVLFCLVARDKKSTGSTHDLFCFQVTTLGKLFTHTCLSPSRIIWHGSSGGDALRLGR